MSKSSTYPIYNNRSGWNAMLPERVALPSSKINEDYEFVIIGAGFTGLAAARRLAQLNPDKQVLLIEATQTGEGSSGRNSGFLISLPHNTKMSGHLSPASVAKKQMGIYSSGQAWLKSIVDEHNIPCNWNPIGKYHAAATESGVAGLKKTIKQLNDWGVITCELSQEELTNTLGTSYYQYGFHSSHNVFIQPAALVRGLVDALPSNVRLLDKSPALAISGQGPYAITLPSGTVRAKTVVLANNGFAKKLGYFNDRLITIYTYAAITPELDGELLQQHGKAGEWGVIPANRLGTTLRKTYGNRFMVRSAYSYEREQSASTVEAMLLDCYRRRYPGLKEHKFEHVWGGVTALTRNGATFFGKVTGNLYASLGCNGAGVLKGTAYGKLLAEMIMGSQSTELSDAIALEPPSWLPPEPIRRIAVTTAIRLQKAKAGLEC